MQNDNDGLKSKYDEQVQRIQAAVDAGKNPPKAEGEAPAEDAPAEA